MGIGLYNNLSLQKRIESLKDAPISDINKKFILDFVDFCFSEGLSKHRVIKYISILKSIAIQIQIDFDKIEKKDLYRFISDLERSDKSEWVKHDYKISLKKFYKWQCEDERPELTKWINTTMKKRNKKLPEEMLTEIDVLNLIDNAESVRDKAIVALLWDIGARIGEIGTLSIKHIRFDQYGATVNVKGKTGYRRVRAVWSVEYLKAWLEVHPEKYNQEARLWVTLDSEEGSLKPLYYDAIRMKLKRLAKQSGIQVRIHPHLFRHSRCTYMANYLTESQMDAYFGWVQGSGMPSVYVHLSGRDIDDAILKANGVIEKVSPLVSNQNKIESPKIDLSSVIEAKVSKLVEAKIAELLGA